MCAVHFEGHDFDRESDRTPACGSLHTLPVESQKCLTLSNLTPGLFQLHVEQNLQVAPSREQSNSSDKGTLTGQRNNDAH